jgi:hypothetical protein
MSEQPLMNASTGRLSTWTGKDPAGKSQQTPVTAEEGEETPDAGAAQDGAEQPPTP